MVGWMHGNDVIKERKMNERNELLIRNLINKQHGWLLLLQIEAEAYWMDGSKILRPESKFLFIRRDAEGEKRRKRKREIASSRAEEHGCSDAHRTAHIR